MYIKGIRISGFKSYKDETHVEDLYNGLNVIVGRNGSGKSNVFSAIEFALTIDYSRFMKAEARSSLIYHGRSNPDPSFVEIAFDNSDRKLPVDDDNVIFRRTLAQKKDRFYVNGRELAHAKQFLDAAGFTNPYFIVKQGKIHDLALATDAARLKVISDVTGANAFNSKIADCQRVIEGADSKKAEIQKMLEELYERKDSLETEVEEQRSFIKCDQAKRAIEFVLHTRKIEEIQTSLDSLEDSRQDSSVRQKPILDRLEKISRDIQIYNRDVGESEARMKQLHDLKRDYESTINRMTTTLSNYNQDLGDLNAKPDNRSSNASELQKEISEYEIEFANLQNELLNMKDHLDNLFYRKCEIESRVNQFREMEMIKGKAGDRSYQTTKLKEIAADLAKCNKSLSASQKALSEYRQRILDEESALQLLREEVISLNNDSNETCRKIEACKMDEQECKTLLEVKWQQLSEIEQMIEQKRDHVMRLEEDWKKHIGISVLKGWKGVQKILEDFRAAGVHQDILNGYYGLVLEIMECDPHLDVAVEVAAGKKLVHHVVESRNIAEQILNEFNSRKMPGELNFMYISSTTRSMSQLDDMELQGAKPIKSLLRFPKKFVSVADSVFGKTLLCETFETATQMMRQHNVQCVTLEGEKVSKVGVMTGGYRARRPQNFELQRAKMADKTQLSTLYDMKRDLDNELAELKRKYQESKKIYEKSHLQRSNMQESKRRKLTEIQNNDRKIRSMYEAMQTLDKAVVDLNANIRVLKERESLMQNSDVAFDKVETLKEFRTARTKYQQVENQYYEKQKERNALDAKLRQSRNNLHNLLSTSTPDNENYKRSAMDRLNAAIIILCKQIKDVKGKLDAANQELVSLQRLVRSKQKKVEELSESEKQAKTQLMEICNELDAFSVKHACWFKKLEEQKAVGVVLGSVPANLEEFEQLRDKELYKQLKKLNIKLKDSTKKGVNQKAIQQFEELKSKCDSFERQMENFADSEKELAAFLRDLETKKGEAMLRNVRLIQEEFGRIFQKIVPLGKAELILYGKSVSIDHHKDIEKAELLELAGRDVFEGVKVCVNFMGQQLHNSRGLAQLSGGQKSIIALCLILAIQTIDPVPFYLFDEVDQALDTMYRDAVARVVAEMSERSQFICTTFRREFLTVADKIFGVSFDNRCSHIQPISDEQAMSFVETEYNSMSMESSSISPSGSFCHSNSAA